MAESVQQVAVARVVEHRRQFAGADFGQHIRQHWAQARPRHHSLGTHAGEALLYPAHQRLNAVVTNIAVRAVKLSGTGHAEAVVAQAAGHQFGFVIQQAHRRCGLL